VKRIEVLYEDDECLVLNKPAGLAVQGGSGLEVSLDSILAETFSPRPLLVHRLDRDTSGIILTAKTRAAAARFSRLFGDTPGGGLVKQYLAVCAGHPSKAAGSIALDLEIRGRVKKSETRYRVLEQDSLGDIQVSLLELELGTGRMHQIRRHLAMTGNPVLGDDKYGDFSLNRNLRKTLKLKRLLLHAFRLLIPRPLPETGVIDVSAPLPGYWPLPVKP
jgi:23S rRNA pseudouridine955/2504/2580 synthase